MMNPQYMPPGQNNNPPTNPIYPPTSQDFNGVQNANIYNHPNSGPPKPFDQTDMSQKMQGMSLNGPQGFSVPPSQVPPGQMPPNFPPTSFAGRPPVSAASFPPAQPPPSSTPGPQFPMQPGLPPDNRFSPGKPPSQPMGPGQMPPSSQGLPPQPGQTGPGGPQPRPGMPPMTGAQPGQLGPGQQSRMPPQSQPGSVPPGPMNFSQTQGLPPQPGQSQPGMPPQPMAGQPGLSQAGPMPPGQPGFQSQPGQMPGQQPQPVKLPQPGLPPQSTQMPGPPGQPQSGQMSAQPSLSTQPGMPPQTRQPGLPPQPGQMPGLPGQMPGQPGLSPQPGQMSGQPGLPPQTSQMPGQSGQMPGQPGQMPGQPGLPPQPGKLPGQPGLPPQPGQMQGQPGLPPQPGLVPGQPGQMPGQPGQMPGQPRLPPQPSQMPGLPGQFPSQPGLPPQPGMPGQPGLPGQFPSQPGLPPQPGMPGHHGLPLQPGQMPGQLPPQPGQPGMPPSSQFQSMPGMPHMPPPLSQSQYPGQQPGFQQPPTSGGYPAMGPQPGQPPAGYGQGYPGQHGGAFPAQQPGYPGQYPQQKRLDPDQMPSPIQVMLDDQSTRGGVFATSAKGQVPPLVTTDFVVEDRGNSSPRYIRSSMYSVPVTTDLLKQTAMPFCLVISPMAETVGPEPEPPLLDFAALTGSAAAGPVRCSRCKAYMCPNMKFVDAGRHFKCAFCKATTEVPMEYTQYINSMQQYGRTPAEMALGTYEIVATKEYCRNNTLPNPPAIVFVIDVSYNSVKNGMLQTVCDNVMDIIEAMPKDEQTGKSWTRVGFITYSSTVHFYNIKGTLAQPQMLSVGDVGDMFVPLLEGFLSYPEEAGPVLQQLLQQLPVIFQDNKETETILLPAVQAGLEALKAADTSGQLFVFHTTLPTYNAPGKLANRENRKLLGTDKEKEILSPQSTAYNDVGQACAAAGVGVEMFVCNNAYVDVATIGQLARLSGGQLHKYTYFTAELDGPRLAADVARAASRPTAHDAVMRVRTSTGVRPVAFYGHFYMANTTDVELAVVDADKAVGVEVKHDDKLTGEEGVFVQAALLYTHRSGQRRLRVLNLALAVAPQLADVYRAVELDTALNFLTKQAVWAVLGERGESARLVREALSSRVARSLATYRRHCASPSSAGQLVLPEAMKLLPLYVSCVLRGDALAGGPDMTCDDRSMAMARALTADVGRSLVYAYPRLLPLHRAAAGQPAAPLRASIEKMTDHGLYLLENGVHILIWVGSQAPAELVRDVFGVNSPQQIDTQVCELPVLDNPASEAVRAVVAEARAKRREAMRLTIMRQHDKLETVLRHFLVEDRGVDGSASYVDYLCHIHKEIRALL